MIMLLILVWLILIIIIVFFFLDFWVMVIVLILILLVERMLVILVIMLGIFWWIMINVGVFIFKDNLKLFNLEIWMFLLLIEIFVIDSFWLLEEIIILMELGWFVFLFLGIK